MDLSFSCEHDVPAGLGCFACSSLYEDYLSEMGAR